MNDNEIKQLLENLEVQPSARCWDAIESGIAAAGSTAGGASAATKAAAQATRHLSAAAVKTIIAGSAVTIAVGGALVATLLLPNANTPSTPAESSLTAHTTSLPSPSVPEDLLVLAGAGALPRLVMEGARAVGPVSILRENQRALVGVQNIQSSGMNQIDIYSIDGKLVRSLKVEDDTVQIDGLESGIYMLRIIKGDEVIVRKVVKQ